MNHDDDVLNAITPLMDGIITAYVLLAEFVNANGEKVLFSATMPDQRSHTTLGMLAYGDAVERHQCVEQHFGDES